MKKHIPNFITCLNLTSGVLGILYAESNLIFASYAVLVAAVFDFLDGMVARLLHVSSAIGKELDSLCDVVSFGVLPGIIIWKLFEAAFLYTPVPPGYYFLIFLSVLIPVFSALRLAKFNLDERQVQGFIGLPTPANAMFIASIPLIVQNPNFQTIFLNVITLSLISIVMSFLLVSEIPLFALKFKNFRLKDNFGRYLFLVFSCILFLVLRYLAAPFIILIYIVLSIALYLFRNKKANKAEDFNKFGG